jgi:uncharacterized RDD family membrane protein YckC
MVYDTFLVAPLLMANAFAWVTLFGPTDTVARPAVPAWVMQSSSLCVITLFFAIFWCKSGQTLGMQAWRIKVVTVGGEPLTPGRAILRCASALLSLLPMGLGYFWSILDRSHLTWHDRLSATHLVLLPKQK